ncbi:MAG: AAA family ATPase, partial [Deltaproteobacteria bacterium]|nr:AAA family ATPase [Deltaproteobacteria bacterium]
MKNLPVSDSTFEKIITQDLLYADKTAYIFEMIKPSTTCCFLSRPRRFGKTLLLDTIENLFLGHRELFKGLWIASREANYDFKRHPVIRLSMAYSEMGSPDRLKKRIANNLLSIAGKEEVKITEDSYGEILGQLIEGLSEKHGTGVVILVDEYDAPVTRHIEDLAVAKANSGVLHDFYTSLKSKVKYVRFALVTGITRFALTSMDSGPNNFTDISLLPGFGGVCGFTISEFDRLFGDRMDSTLRALLEAGEMPPGSQAGDLRKAILTWYDGYNWLGPERVLNPYSILNLFYKQSLAAYWPLSGLPNHLSALVRQRPLDFMEPQLSGHSSEQIRKASLGRLDAVPVLFHSGYLTIDDVKVVPVDTFMGQEINDTQYSFRLPNAEVKLCYSNYCFETVFGQNSKQLKTLGANFLEYIDKRDSHRIGRLFSDLLSNVTYWQHPANGGGDTGQEGGLDEAGGESFYHGLIQISLSAMGLKTLGETAGS